jgi:hypothetical protein
MRAIVHVADTTLSSKARYQYDQANGSMMAQLARGEALELLRAHEFDVGFRDYAYFHVRLVTYQQDLREFVLNPFSRIRTISQRLRAPLQPITHINDNAYTYASFTARGDLAACVQNSAAGLDDQGRPVPEKKDGEKYDPTVHRTDRHHRHAVTVTCDIALREKNFEPPGETQWRDLYFRRLQRMYDEIYADGRLVITIIPPYSDLIHHANTDERIARWKKRIAEINAGRPYALIDMRRSLNSFDSPEGRHYFYDVLHLNAAGSLAWTEQMASELARHRNLITLNSRGSVQQTR